MPDEPEEELVGLANAGGADVWMPYEAFMDEMDNAEFAQQVLSHLETPTDE